MEGVFSTEFENRLLDLVDQRISKYEIAHEELKAFDDIVPQSKLLRELEISTDTLDTWESNGLARYTPPYAASRKVYYRKQDVTKFLGMK
ncbi:hypothetical protein ACI1UE_01540 [Lactococcus petauri]|uniref:hypothetical protein n=1 Tax=Lactococcus TaxID=1357 RepID=UPI0024C4DA99|nr:hypothetical protein [Lactococcus sp. bn62]WKY24543.1 hypothetical protein P3G65_01670 [Lactococcus sp. bn62]